jgi:hypothetical protein
MVIMCRIGKNNKEGKVLEKVAEIRLRLSEADETNPLGEAMGQQKRMRGSKWMTRFK